MEIKPIIFTKSSSSLSDLNTLFNFYKDIWVSTFSDLKSSKNSIVEDFHRFDVKLGLFSENRPIAFHGYQFFDLRLNSDAEHPYFSQVDVPLVERLLSRGIKKISTLEYMCVCPEFRKTGNRRIGEILGGYSTQYFIDKDVDGVVTITRNNRGVNAMCKMYGAEPLYENLKLHNVEVDVMLFEPRSVQENPDPNVQATISQLLELSRNEQINHIEAAA